ncbi:MAG: hypothetical protein M3Y69_09945, partial [Verrucomicrobiota bacterium]|nr:hypothetical protein [Verrucomicrobiota bacterium]
MKEADGGESRYSRAMGRLGKSVNGSNGAAVRGGCVAIVIVDQEPLRGAAGAECSAAMAQLDDARSAWHRYEREDKPSFARWRAREFGALLSESRDVELQIRESETLVHEVEMEMRRGFMDPQTAYRRIMARRGNPVEAAAQQTRPPRNDAG